MSRPENPPSPVAHRVDEQFAPLRCPNALCPSRSPGTPFRYRCKGRYQRRVDLRVVQRYQCMVCRRGFSSQTFRVDFRYHRPLLHLVFFPRLVAKCSLRQAARELRCHRDTLLLRLARLGPHARWLNETFLQRHRDRQGGLSGAFQLDELETFETDRRLFPVTVPVLVHEESRLVVHVAADTLPARGNLRPADKKRLVLAEKRHGRRKNRSRSAVTECFRKLEEATSTQGPLRVRTDCKPSYSLILQAVFAGRVQHQTVHSQRPRGPASLLFPVNHTLAMMRDGMGRLVRRNWGNSKKRRNLAWHLWNWVVYRNFVREIFNRNRAQSSASVVGVASRRLTPTELLEWTDRLPRAA